MALAAIVAIVVAPLVEELCFRGAGYAALRFRLGPLASALLTGMFFGALHFRPWLIIPLAFIGILLGWLYERTNSILPGMIAHATHNSACVVIFLLYFS